MEMNKAEVTVVADAIAHANETLTIELSELQLALIGGGVGEVVLS